MDLPPPAAALLSKSGNDYCADCQQSGPDWVSLNFGVVVCLECAGKHRGFGVHITQVRSLRLDTLSAQQLQYISAGGNDSFLEYLAAGSVVVPINYLDENVLYYREILNARVQGRSPVEKEQYLATLKNVLFNNASSENREQPRSPASPTWVADAAASQCMICKEPFTLLFRRHHCRRCGRCVCSSCAPKENARPILEWGLTGAVRHCKDCYRSPVLEWT